MNRLKITKSLIVYLVEVFPMVNISKLITLINEMYSIKKQMKNTFKHYMELTGQLF